MSNEPPKMAKPPGLLWIMLLGVVGFAAGFCGPLIFAPDANQGPLVGILLTGPGGALLGVVLFVLMKFLPLSARAQWSLLVALCVLGTLATCYLVQPEPATRGYELELNITAVRTPAEMADKVVADWRTQIARVTWAAPRTGWDGQMRAAMAADKGVVFDALVVRQRAIKAHRKLWNRGQVFAAPWQAVNEKRSYYVRPGDPAGERAGAGVRLFIDSDSSGPIRAPNIWPPVELEAFIGLFRVTAVPTMYQNLP